MKHISVHDFKEIVQAQQDDLSVDFLNVCTPEEYKEKHIQGVRNVPLDTLTEHLDEFKNKKTIYIHCRGGGRGKMAIQTLESHGVDAELVNVEGGLRAWGEAGFETHSQ